MHALILLGTADPIIKYVELHETECSLQTTEDLISALLKKKDDPESLEKMSALIHEDLAIRSRAIAEFGLSLEAELFIFGRPLFKILNARGFQTINLMTS